jgi:uncharacterized protein YmfQ (DUF2313 family)
VTLTGFNLDTVTGVQVGSLDPVVPVIFSSRELEFTTPPGTGYGVQPITLLGAFGTAAGPDLTFVDLGGLDNYHPRRYAAAEYTSQLFELLPKGPAWTRRLVSTLGKILSACAEELSRVHGREDELLDEHTPSHTRNSLAEWETELGLPEIPSETELAPSVRAREVFRKANSLGGCSAGYFENLAALLGIPLVVEELYTSADPFKAGSAVAGDALTQGPWLFAWKVTISAASSSLEDFTAGHSVAGDPLRVWGLSGVEKFLDSLKPSHTILVYTYDLGP